ncbi:MAG: hypothetical protein M1830_005071 [Pleopsidium flavum]|nr:MAG: hypothetical protein M1830_005071 [Pleopsidium flavum]
MQLNRFMLALSAMLASISALPQLGLRDAEQGLWAPTSTKSGHHPDHPSFPTIHPTQPLPTGYPRPTGQPFPTGGAYLPPVGPRPQNNPYHPNPSPVWRAGLKPIRVVEGPYPPKGEHTWDMDCYGQQSHKSAGTGIRPTATGTRGIRPTRTGTGGVAKPTGAYGAAIPMPPVV